jgi:NAD(P)-dependent dehydrogenase (short-subunit alcohol dehydrogenase family)
VTDVFRSGLLDGQVVAVLAAGELGAASAQALERLGAQVTKLESVAGEDAFADALPSPLHTLVIDAAGLFAAAPADGLVPLRAAADTAWIAARAAGNTVLIPGGGGKIVVVAPRPGAGPHAEAARAGLENFARTLSIEWARHDIRITTIHPGADTSSDDVAALVAYLGSPAGDYFSGCLFSLV